MTVPSPLRSELAEAEDFLAVDPNPNPKALAHDSAKSIVTIAVAVLGLSATFMAQLKGAAGGLGFFAAAWAALVLTIICGVWASGSIIHGLKDGKDTKAGVFLNLSLLLLVVASIFLAIGAYQAVNHGNDNLATAADLARNSITSLHPNVQTVRVTDVIQDENEIHIKLVDVSGAGYSVTLSRHPLRVTQVQIDQTASNSPRSSTTTSTGTPGTGS